MNSEQIATMIAEHYGSNRAVETDYDCADRILVAIAAENATRDEAVRELQEALHSWFGWLSLHEDKTGSIATVRYRQDDFDEVVRCGQSALAKLKEHL